MQMVNTIEGGERMNSKHKYIKYFIVQLMHLII